MKIRNSYPELKRNIRIIFFSFSLLIFISCKEIRQERNYDEAHNLYSITLKTYEDYIEKMENVSDSIEFNKVIRELDNSLTRINYEFSPNVDLLLTEQENDSIIKISKKFLKIKLLKEEQLRTSILE